MSASGPRVINEDARKFRACRSSLLASGANAIFGQLNVTETGRIATFSLRRLKGMDLNVRLNIVFIRVI